jgi:hypothetical protein
VSNGKAGQGWARLGLARTRKEDRVKGRWKLLDKKLDLGLNTVAELRVHVWNGRGLSQAERLQVYKNLIAAINQEVRRLTADEAGEART